MSQLPKDWKLKSKNHRKNYLRWLKSKEAKSAIKKLPEIDELIFEKIDCLSCAGCCSTISPRFKTPDIKRISKHLGLRESQLIDRYLRVDEDGDFVVQSSPCPFLGAENYCDIYEVRPRDCANYPYIDSDQFVKRPTTTIHNSTICPAVYSALEVLTSDNPG